MKKLFLLLIIPFIASVNILAQQGMAVNTTGAQPNASAILDISSSAKGLLIPRLTAAQRTAIAAPAIGLLLYQTDATKGFYYFDGSGWQQMALANANLSGWSTTGNAGINQAANFIGTTDAQPLIAKVNGQVVFRFSPSSSSTLYGYQASNAIPDGGGENHFIGYQAGFTNTGYDNQFEGFKAGYSNTSGAGNQFIGYRAGYFNTTGADNLFVGSLAGNNNTTAGSNHFIGKAAGFANTTGGNNHFSGYNAGVSNTFGSNNQFEGYKSGYSNTSGANNFFQGYQSGYSNTTGSSNYCSGNSAGYLTTTGFANQFTGNSAGYSNVTGSYNSFTGHHSGFSNTTGKDNVAAGAQSLNNNTNGNSNTAIGRTALFSNVSGYSNVAIGVGASFSSTTATNNVAVGDSALYNNQSIFYDQYLSSNNTALGSKVLLANFTGKDNTGTGYYSLLSNTDGDGNTADGAFSMISSLGNFNTAMGYFSMPGLQSGDGNIAIGCDALLSFTNGGYNTAVGNESSITDGLHSAAVFGEYAHATASNQVVIGGSAVTQIGGITSWTNLSDGRFKKDLQENVSGLAFITALRPVTYKLDIKKLNNFLGEDERTENARKMRAAKGIRADSIQLSKEKKLREQDVATAESIVYSGFVAQEVEATAKKIGYDFSGVKRPQNDKDHYGLAYSDFVVPLVKAVQEQQKIIETLQAKNSEQQKENEQLKKDLQLIKAKLGIL